MRVSHLKAAHSNRTEANNNPVMFTDPTGLLTVDQIMKKVNVEQSVRGGTWARDELRAGLNLLNSTAVGRSILWRLKDDSFKEINLQWGYGSGRNGSGDIDLDLALDEKSLYEGPNGSTQILGLLDSVGDCGNDKKLKVSRAIAFLLAHEFNHSLGDYDQTWKIGSVKLFEMSTIMTVDNPLRQAFGLPLRLSHGTVIESSASDRTAISAIRGAFR